MRELLVRTHNSFASKSFAWHYWSTGSSLDLSSIYQWHKVTYSQTATIVWPFHDPYLTFIRRFNSITDLCLMLNLKVEIWDWAYACKYLSECKEVSNNMISYLTNVPRAKNVKDVMSMSVYVMGLLTLIHLTTTYILIKSILAMKHSKSIRSAEEYNQARRIRRREKVYLA